MDRILKISKDGQNCKLSYYFINYYNNYVIYDINYSALGMSNKVSIRPVGFVIERRSIEYRTE